MMDTVDSSEADLLLRNKVTDQEETPWSRTFRARFPALLAIAACAAVVVCLLPAKAEQNAVPGLRSSISLASDWSEYVGRNCYPGHGGVGLAEGYELQGSFAVEACKAECEKVSSCAGIVIAQQHVMGQGPCWRLASLSESECLSNTPYNTWQRGGVSSVTPQVAPTPVPAPAPAPVLPEVTPAPATPAPAPAPAPAPVPVPPAQHQDLDSQDDPNWGCGLLGNLPGISADGQTVAAETQRMIDGLKKTSTFGKVAYWNWNLAPQTDEVGGKKVGEHLTSDFLFTPEQWGAGEVTEKYLRPAGEVNFLDSNGQPCPAQMANILLGTNEPDIYGSCMGNMFGKCRSHCETPTDCPVARLDLTAAAEPNSRGECNCWQYSHATGAGFWPLAGCSAAQPLPKMWEDPGCVDTVMNNWRKTARSAYAKGYKFLTTPLVAENLDYAKSFIEHACGCVNGQCSCQDASCGCPVYVGFHFYAYDCLPEGPGGYDTLQHRLEAVAKIMELYPFVKGAIINEVGMLNCASEDQNPICVPNSGQNPGKNQQDRSCPVTDQLPHGMASFIKKLFDYIKAARTKDGREVVKHVSWFNHDEDGGVYNLLLFGPDGRLNEAGEAYLSACEGWRR